MPKPTVSAAVYRGFRIEIDQEKLNALYSRILKRPQNAPPIYFKEMPDSPRTFALYDPSKKEIHLLLSNWPARYFKDYQSFKKRILNSFVHECSHAIGDTKSPPLLMAKIHKWIFKIQIAAWKLVPDRIPRRLLFLLPVTLITFLFLGQYYQIFYWIFWTIVLFHSIITLGFEILIEILATVIKNGLLKQYDAEFQEIVKVTKI